MSIKSEKVPSFIHVVTAMAFGVAGRIVPDGPWSVALGIIAIVFLFMGIAAFREEREDEE